MKKIKSNKKPLYEVRVTRRSQKAWRDITRKFAEEGTPEITHLKIHYSLLHCLESLEYRDKDGKLQGVMLYYSDDTLPEPKKGNVDIYVNPKHSNEDICIKLFRKGFEIWNFDFDKQEYLEIVRV